MSQYDSFTEKALMERRAEIVAIRDGLSGMRDRLIEEQDRIERELAVIRKSLASIDEGTIDVVVALEKARAKREAEEAASGAEPKQ